MADKEGAADQSAIFAFLADPATHGLSEPIKRVETHGAVVFLAGGDVYKVKRAVHFAYMDFSTLEKRKAACEAEIAVNRDNAPGLYIETMPITRDAQGLHLSGDGDIVEWAVHLRRFDENATLDHLADKGPLGAELIKQLSQVVIASHRRAPLRDGEAATIAFRRALANTTDELCQDTDLFPAKEAAALRARLMSAFDLAEALLLRRGKDGKVRRCHGDLHLRNIALIDNAPVLFDAIEFDEAIATTDILYDLAFLLMDLWQGGLHGDANTLLNRYLWGCGDEQKEIEGLALLPLFLSLRAAIRAVVTATQSRSHPGDTNLRDEALSYFESARRFLDVSPPCLIAIGGFSGSGKSVLSTALAPSIGSLPGAIQWRSDIERKRRFGVAETDRLPQDAYRPEVSAEIYDRLLRLAEAGLKAGRGVILDATYTKAESRQALGDLAAKLGVRLIGLWLEAPLDLLSRRVSARRGDASDATPEVLAAQAKEELGEINWQRLDASQNPEALKADALAAIA